MKKRALFVDRDGTLIVEPENDLQVDSLEKLEFIPGVFRNLYRIRHLTPYELIMVSNQDGMGTALYPEEDFRDYSRTALKQMFEAMAEEPLNHYKVWTDAILDGTQANSHFGYAGPLNEIAMVGTIAQRLPERELAWNAAAMTFDDPDATALVRRTYRKGWEIASLAC